MSATGLNATSWYVVQTKPKQEFRALEQLENQGFTCFLPTLDVEKIVRGKVESRDEPLFSRYLFLRLNEVANDTAPIRSTRGVSKLVAFGGRFATLPDPCVEALRSRPRMTQKELFAPGERITITHGPFAGLEGIYQLPDGEARAMVLIELMSRPQKLTLAVEALRKAA